MVEQECIAGLYQSVGISVGGEFSPEDVGILFHKVFHLPSTTDDVHIAIKKLYWDLQLLNVWKPNTLYMTDTQDIIDRQALNGMHSHTDTTTVGSITPCTVAMDLSERQRLAGNREQKRRGVWRLKRAARQCWARLVAEGVHSILPLQWHCQGLEVRGQAWGRVSLSDLLLLVEVKYDVVTHMLYTEMLQEHYGLTVWDTLLPWQQNQEEEELEDLAEEALDSGDLLRLAELPGAFRIYRVCEGVSFKGSPESGEPSWFWSAITLLSEVHACRQQERDTLTALSKRLDRETLRLICLYIRLATFRAQRETMSYGALLAARQFWETWPCISSPCKKEKAALWQQGEEKEGKEKELLISVSPQQQAVLQRLVLCQVQERKYLLRLLHGVSLEDLQGPGGLETPREDKERHAALRDGCIRRLRQIHSTLQTHTLTQIQTEQSSPLPPRQAQPQTTLTHKSPQIQTQAQISSSLTEDSQPRWGSCALDLLKQLIELQEAQVSVVLPALLHMTCLQSLRNEYQTEPQEQHLTNLLHLLTSDAPPTSDSLLINDPIIAQKGPTGPLTAHNSNTADPIRSARREPNPEQIEDGFERHDLCTGCGANMEDLPYLEILCVSDVTNISNEGHAEEKGAEEGQEEGSPRKTPQSYEKQGSLITLAWSKPPEENTDYQAERTVKSADGPGDTHTQAWQSHCEETPGESQVEVSDASLVQYRSREPVAPVERHITEQREKTREDPSDSNLQTHALVAETSEVVQTRSLASCPGFKQHTVDLPPEITNEKAFAGGGITVEVEMCPTQTESERWHPEGPEPPHPEDHEYASQVTVDSKFPEREATVDSMMMQRERTREPVSVMERERTMRSLVDMQRKVEQKQQRDRERQLLRVQERLSIIQNRKAEEDLLGLKQRDRLRHVTDNLPQEDKSQQKTVVRERLEQLRRERSYVMQSKRDRNTAGFKELLGPVALHSAEREDGVD
ncbi:uncharacterized protein ACJ7VT_007672 [Polymixia lowei]